MSNFLYRLGAPLMALLFFAVALPGCEDEELEAVVKALGEGCLIDSDCAGELVCVFRRCHVECETDRDCVAAGTGPYCRLGDRPTNVCLLPDEQECTIDSDCPTEAMMCGADDICRDRCADDAQCLPEQSCLKAGCGNIEEEGLDATHPLLSEAKGDATDPCLYNSQCKSPLACLQGRCREECIDDRDCPSNAACVVIPDGEVPDTRACVVVEQPPIVEGEGPAHCTDGTTSGDESGVDCGGSCAPCPTGGGCTDAGDCGSGVCTGGSCQAPTCSDGVRNGTELDIDCGGTCPACPAGSSCSGDGDCMAPDTCDTAKGICVAPTCSDGLENETETDVDCGGPACAPCDPLKTCLTPGDCTSLVCAAGTCLVAGCNDGVQNGAEADVDCGGTSGCAPCGLGAECSQGSDCVSGSCSGGICATATCSDGVQNGLELGVDCGGPSCAAGCAVGNPCLVDDDCDQTSPTGCHPTNLTCTPLHTVTVVAAGAGTGTVTSTPAGIDCGATCAMEVLDGASLTLDAIAGMNSAFAGFTGDCVGGSPCVFAVTGDASVTAAFESTSNSRLSWAADPSIGEIVDIAVDSQGQAFIFVDGAGDLGCGLLAGNTGDFSLAKYIPGLPYDGGGCLGSLVDSGSGFQNPIAFGVNASDDVIVLFNANSTFTLTGHPTETCAGTQGFALARYDGSLSQIAADHTPCLGGSVLVYDMVIQPVSGNIVVLGRAGTNQDIGGPTPIVDTTAGKFFVARYDGTTLDLINFVQFGKSPDDAHGLAVDATDDDIAVTMSCDGPVDFGNGVVSLDIGADSYDPCVVKLDSGLVPQWAYQYGSASGTERGVASTFLPNGDLITTGYVSTQAYFGDGLLAHVAGTRDVAIVHLADVPTLDPTIGEPANLTPGTSWALYGTPDQDEPFAVVAAPGTSPLAGSFFVAMKVSSTYGIDVGGGALPAGVETVLARYDGVGNLAWVTWNDDNGNIDAMSVMANGAPLLSGDGFVDWGTGPLNGNYVARFDP